MRPPDFFVVLDPGDGEPHFTYKGVMGKNWGHGHINDVIDADDGRGAERWVVRSVWLAEKAVQAENDQLRRVLTELVKLNEMKRKLSEDNEDMSLRFLERTMYHTREPLAWSAARLVLGPIDD